VVLDLSLSGCLQVAAKTNVTEDPMTDRIVFLPELIETIGVSRTTINRWRASGRLPEPDCMMSQRWQGWRRSTLERVGLLVPAEATPQYASLER